MMISVIRKAYYEMMPNRELFIVEIRRSLREVVEERTKVASYFQSIFGKMEILSGVCDIMKADLVFDEKGISIKENKFPIHIELQNLIDVYNDITGEEVIDDYKKKQTESS